jgi:hypothetical protein
VAERLPPYDARPVRLRGADLSGEALEARTRAAGVAVAGALVGVHRDPWAELDLMLPFDADPDGDREGPRDYLRGGVSTCALAARGYLLLLGSGHEALWRPYLPRVGRAVADVVQIARDGGAWRTPEPGRLPHPGDVVLVGHMLPGGAPDPAYVRGTRATEHVLIYTGPLGEEGLLMSVDGGQPGVEWRTRRLVRFGRELWLSHTAHGIGPDGRPLVGRRVVGWLSLADLPLEHDALVPEDADLGA